MGNFRLEWTIASVAWRLTLIVFPFALLVFAFSSCNLRYRSEKRACRNGSADKCLEVGRFYEARTEGLFAFLLSNGNTAKEYYDRGCKLGDRTCCARLGHMLVVGSYDTARDSDLTYDDGIQALTTACNGDDSEACRELAGASDPEHAAPILAKLCDSGDKDSCDKLVAAYLATDPKRAVELLDKRCNTGDNEQCRELGGAFLKGSRYVDADPARGLALLGKACDRGDWGGCRELGEADPSRTGELLAKACAHDDQDACFELGKLQIAGDATQAVQTFTAECEQHGDPRGCDALGDLYRVGTAGIERDRARAISFYDSVCRAGDDFDCHKRDCYRNADSDSCYKVHEEQDERRFRLGGRFDMR